MLAFIFSQNFITTEGLILFLLFVALIGASLITLISLLYQSIQKKINLQRLTILFFGLFMGLFSLSIALIFLIFGGF
ncbi:hypothetical protein [Empedobacter brevis]|uniref:Uncharacterized protein n=1 Tax=Empedobacter brevis NBRC 14943 = ATCC 43319 TaxID=1218108 RepID=A0A511NGF8_9FLAO|nr:hypothetical protein [Empedobacter brevis]QHC84821.1 hypothetical protein AS589_08550 [Empedobacter brevis]GEM51736.1 hypothetical protein EB1_15260 [Empedobacter brevis NBRC 14943 = ATCC 43319]